jgi:hypothetical protein
LGKSERGDRFRSYHFAHPVATRLSRTSFCANGKWKGRVSLVTMTTLLSEDRRADLQCEILLCLHLSEEGSSESASRLRSSAGALIKDVLFSKLDIEAEVNAPEMVHVRGSCDIESALATCRVLQLAFEGFCRINLQVAGVSVLLDAEPYQALSADQKPSPAQTKLLASADPFQVLVTQSFYAELQRRVPEALRSFQRQGGVFEFLWTSNQRLAELQRRNELGRTVVFPVSSSPATEEINDRTIFDDSPSQDLQPPPFDGSANEAEDQLPARRRRGWIVASCVVALLAILTYLGLSYTTPGNQLEQVAAIYLNGPDAPPAPAAPGPPPPFPVVVVVPPPSPQPIHGPKPPPPHAPCAILKTLIPEHLNIANNYLNKEKFQDAMREYTKVLNCDPGNATAKDGMQRAKQAQAQ